MKKLTEEEIDKIASDTFYEMFPNYTDKDENDFKTLLLNTILTAVSKFMIKYQEEVDK